METRLLPAIIALASLICARTPAQEDRGGADAKDLVDILARGAQGQVRPLFDLLGGGIRLDEIAKRLGGMVREEDAPRVREIVGRLKDANADYLAGYYGRLVEEDVTNRAGQKDTPWRTQVAQGALHIGLRRMHGLPARDRAGVAGRVGGEVGLALLYECCQKEWPDEATAALASMVPRRGAQAEWRNFDLALGAGLGNRKDDRESLRPVIAALEKRALELTATGAAPPGGEDGACWREVQKMLCSVALPLSDGFKAEVRARNERSAKEGRLPVCAVILACDGDGGAVAPVLPLLDAPAPDDRLAAAMLWNDLARYAWRSKATDRKTGAAYSGVRLASLCAFDQNAAFAAHFRKWWLESGSKMTYVAIRKRWLCRTEDGGFVSDAWESMVWGQPGKGAEAGAAFGAFAKQVLDLPLTRTPPHTVAGALFEMLAQEFGLYLAFPLEMPAGLSVPVSAEVRDVKVKDMLGAICAGCRLKMAPLRDSARGLLLLADESPSKALPLSAFGPTGRKTVKRDDKIRTISDVSRILREVAQEAGIAGVIMTGYPRRLEEESALQGELPAEQIIQKCASLVGGAPGVRDRLLVIEAPLTKQELPAPKEE